MSTHIENIPDEQQLERLLETVPPEMGERVKARLASAPWTPRAAFRRRTAWIITASFAAILVSFFVSPPGRAWAQAAVRFFTRGSSNTLPYSPPTQSWVDLTPGITASTPIPTPQAAFAAQCGDYVQAHCSVEQIRSMVGFAVTELGAIPEGMYFAGATGGPDQVFIHYDSPGHHGGLTIFESPWTGSEEQTSWLVGPDAVVEKVTIGNILGEYVKGSYFIENGKGPMKWDPNMDVQTLRWVSNHDIYFNNDLFYEMQCSGQACRQDKNSLAALAASLTTQPVSAMAPTMPATPTPDFDFSKGYPLTLAQAEEQAGFQARLPGRMPTVLLPEPVGATYGNPNNDPYLMYKGYHVLTMFYPVNPAAFADPRGSDGLVLSEELLTDPSGCALCGFRKGTSANLLADTNFTGSIVGIDIEKVQIGNVEGKYVEGVWAASAANDGTWIWKPYEFVKRLRWQANGMAYEIQYYGSEVEKADLIAIAESIK
jgi:hypothetical protein